MFASVMAVWALLFIRAGFRNLGPWFDLTAYKNNGKGE